MKQQLSSLIDGEQDLSQCEHLLLAAKSNGEMAESWRIYHLIGDAMRDETWGHVNMSQRVLDAIENIEMDAPLSTESVDDKSSHTSSNVIAIKPNKPRRILNQFSLLSVAASFAAALFVGVLVFQQQGETIAPVQIADSSVDDYIAAHHTFAPNSESYYVHNASYSE